MRVTVIDYGIGNLLSVCRAFEYCGADVTLTGEPASIAQAERLVLPGVGAFGKGMEGLLSRDLIEPIQRFCRAERPFLGICLGMQMMLDSSEEFGLHQGLGLIPGQVVAIPAFNACGQPHKVPSVGWKELVRPEGGPAWSGTILAGLEPNSATYFVHSFTARPANAKNCLASYEYGGLSITAVVAAGLLFGCQFHPEKSGEVGLRILRNFLAI